MSIEVRRAAQRTRTESDGIVSRHSFSFGAHYDPTDVGHALLVAHNDDVVAPGGGYATHPHRDLEIVTWVLEGALRHEDSRGTTGIVVPGLVQRLSAGSGVHHSERNDAAAGSVRFVQMWVLPDEPGGDPSHAQHDLGGALGTGRWVTLASGMAGHRESTAVTLGARDAALHVARLRAGGTEQVPDAPYVHLFVTRGSVELEEAGRLSEGDAVRLVAAGPRRLEAGDDGAEMLVWEMWRGR